MSRALHIMFLTPLAILVMAFGARAQSPSDSLLASYIRESWAKHPDLEAMRAMVVAESSRTVMSRAWMNPEVRGGLMNIPTDFNAHRDPMTMFQIGAMQQIPLPGNLRSASEAGQARTAAARANVQDEEFRMAEMVTMAYYDLAAAVKVRPALEHGRDLTQQLSDAAMAGYSTGTGSQADVLRGRLETDQWNRRLVTNQADIERKRAALAYAVGRTDPSSLTDPILPESLPPVPDLDAAISSESLEGTPAVHRARLQAQAAGADARHARLALLPYVNVGAAYGIRQTLRTGGVDPMTGMPTESTIKQDNMVTLELSIPVPLFYRGNQRAQVSEFQAMRRNAEFDAERSKLDKARELRELHALLKEKVDNYGITSSSVLPQAENVWQASLLDYRGNKLPFMTLTEARMNVVMAQMDAVMLRADAWAAYYRFQAALGHSMNETMGR